MRDVMWPEVLRCLQDDETRSYAIGAFRSGGFDADSFATKTRTREGLCEALVQAEDRLEQLYPGRKTERQAIQAVRRRLEIELWP